MEVCFTLEDVWKALSEAPNREDGLTNLQRVCDNHELHTAVIPLLV